MNEQQILGVELLFTSIYLSIFLFLSSPQLRSHLPKLLQLLFSHLIQLFGGFGVLFLRFVFRLVFNSAKMENAQRKR